MKNYRTLNGLKSDTFSALTRAYDKGYAQGKEDYQREYAEWLPITTPRGLEFLCGACMKKTISGAYLFCPYCGADHRGKEKTDV